MANLDYKKAAITLFILLGIGYTAYNLFSFLRGFNSSEPGVGGRAETESEVTFMASDGYALSAVLWPSRVRRDRSPVIILSHRYDANRHDFDAFIPTLQSNGYAVLSYDIRGFGKSLGGPTKIRDFPKDVVGAVEFLKKQKGMDVSKIGILGIGLGADIAFVSSGSIADIKGAFLVSPSEITSGHALSGEEISNFSPKNIFVISSQDEKTGADSVYARAGEPKEIKIYLGPAKGITLLKSVEVQKDIIFFFNRVFLK